MATVILRPEGIDRRTVEADSIHIPDLWHIAQRLRNPTEREAVLEVWYLCHDLLEHAR